MRIIVFSGKGGSGVSTLAAATAVAGAAGGHGTLAFGLGRGLGHALDLTLGPRPTPVAENLHAVEGRARAASPDEFRDWLQQLLEWRGMETELAEDLAALPGMNHVGLLLQLEAHAASGRYDLVVLDGASLDQFLDLPPALDAAARWLERLFTPRQPTVFDPLLRVFAADYATAGEDVLDRGRELLGRLARLRELLTDRDISSLRIVLTADKASVAEAREAVAALSLFSYPMDAIILNRMLPEQVNDPFFETVRSEQAEALPHLAGSVQPMPVLSLPLQPAAPRRLDSLARLAQELYGRNDPASVLYRGPSRSLSQQDSHYVLSLALPFARREDLTLEQTEEGVAICLEGRRCVLPLPPEVGYQEAASWSLEGDVLRVTFRP